MLGGSGVSPTAVVNRYPLLCYPTTVVLCISIVIICFKVVSSPGGNGIKAISFKPCFQEMTIPAHFNVLIGLLFAWFRNII